MYSWEAYIFFVSIDDLQETLVMALHSLHTMCSEVEQIYEDSHQWFGIGIVYWGSTYCSPCGLLDRHRTRSESRIGMSLL